jgi:hypothetical protein
MMPSQKRLWLDNEKGLFPCPNRPRKKNQEHPVRFGTGRSFHLSPEDDELLAKKRVFCHEFGLASGKVCQRAQQKRGSVRFCPGDEVVVEPLVTKACQPPDIGENPKHSICDPFVKMSE